MSVFFGIFRSKRDQGNPGPEIASALDRGQNIRRVGVEKRIKDRIGQAGLRCEQATAMQGGSLPAGISLGEKGHPEVASEALGSPLLALFERLMRGVGVPQIEELVRAVLAERGDAALEDLHVLAVHTRWCRGGKGERRASFDLLLVLYPEHPQLTRAVVALLPEFGSWRDIVSLAEDASARGPAYAGLASGCWDMLAHELAGDRETLYAASLLRGRPPALSLAAKYAPSERRVRGAVRSGLEVCSRLYGNTTPAARRDYRTLLTSLRRALDLTEPLMCAHRWDDIDLHNVPSRALAKYKRAFLNEGRGGARAEPARARCRARLLAALADPSAPPLKGAQMFPHELVCEAMHTGLSPGVAAVLNAQWGAVRARMQLGGLDATRMVCMADVSGSMYGTPMHVAIALGVLVSELSHPDFRHRVLTFSAEPVWHTLDPHANFVAKVRSLAEAPWGCNTDFAAAVDRIADIVAAGGLQQAEVPDLLVVSDMQFDQSQHGQGAWRLAHEGIAARFRELGVRLHGAPLAPPRIIFWNVRSGATGFQADAVHPGVALLSGYSPALMKAFLSGAADTLAAPDSAGALRTTPADILRAVLEDSALQPVRDVARRCARPGGGAAPAPRQASPRVPPLDLTVVLIFAFIFSLFLLAFIATVCVLLLDVATAIDGHWQRFAAT